MQSTYILAGALWFSTVLLWRLIDNYRKNKREKLIDHRKETRLRTLLLVPSAIMFAMPGIIGLLLSVPMMMIYWLTLFDGFFGIIRDRGFWDLGTNDVDDAATDNFLQGLKHWQHIAFKLGGILITTSIYILWLYRKTSNG